MAIFESEKTSTDIIINDTISDDEVVASDERRARTLLMSELGHTGFD